MAIWTPSAKDTRMSHIGSKGGIYYPPLRLLERDLKEKPNWAPHPCFGGKNVTLLKGKNTFKIIRKETDS